MIKVLIVEDDLDVGSLLKQYLELNKYVVERVFTGKEAREILAKQTFNIAILDVMLPEEDGFTLAEKIRHQYPQLPFLFLTAKKQKEDVLKGLKLGADYITKPFDADELMLRIDNILHKSKAMETGTITNYTIGQFLFEPQNLLLKHAKGDRLLTEKEAQLLEYLYLNKTRLIKRQEVLDHLWEETDFFSGRSLDVFISRLRKHLSADAHVQIESIRGVGYRFVG